MFAKLPVLFVPAFLLIGAAFAPLAAAQDSFEQMPRYDRYERLRRDIAGSIKSGGVLVTWSADGKQAAYRRDGKSYVLDLATGTETEGALSDVAPNRTPGRRAPDRGRQFDVAFTPDGKRKALHRDGNVYLADADGKNELAVTTDGSREARVKYGIASWVYGEELDVREAMWWSPDGTKLAYYRFDEKPVRDYYLQYEQTKFQDTLDTEAYPKAGTDNPIVGLYVYDVASAKSVEVDTKFGETSLGEYVYDVKWTAAGDGLMFNRTNRKQNEMELCIADPQTGKSRAIVRESQPQSWAENHPTVQFLKDNRRFIWSSERNGFRNLYLYDLEGKLIAPLTQQQADVTRIVWLDEAGKALYYLARTGANAYLAQLHRVGLDGKGDRRITEPTLSHSVTISPDGKYFSDIAESAVTPSSTTIYSMAGKKVKVVADSDLSKFHELNLRPNERFSCLAADGRTTIFGSLSFPSDFDPGKKYPLLVSVYGGPESGGGTESFQAPSAICEMGFLVATIEGRGTNGRGKAFRDAVYGKLGVVEIDDQAAGVKALAQRSDVDGRRVGIFGTSYGGYASIMSILRHPETFQVAVASSSVTDWRHYDTIYTERFQGLPSDAENAKGYDEGSAVKLAKNLKGKLMLYYGTADNNVHPANTLQFVQALEGAGKRYDMQVGPDRGHTGINSTRMWEYFVTHLILRSPKEDALAVVWKRRR